MPRLAVPRARYQQVVEGPENLPALFESRLSQAQVLLRAKAQAPGRRHADGQWQWQWQQQHRRQRQRLVVREQEASALVKVSTAS